MLTDRQQEIYSYILAFRRDNGCSPSIPEIQKQFGIRSPNGVVGHLEALQAKGYIRRGNRGSRQIDVVAEEREQVPLYGSIAAGYPDVVEQGAGEYVPADAAVLGFTPKKGCFALRVRGDSMQNAGILDGDLVVIEPVAQPREQQIVAALIDGDCTLKRLVRLDGNWYLKAENPAYPELRPKADLAIQGVVRTVIRRLG